MKRNLAFLLFGALLGVLIFLNFQRMQQGSPVLPLTDDGAMLPPISVHDLPEGYGDNPTRAAAAVLEKVVVNIDTLGRPVGVSDWFGMSTRWVQPQGAGSGVIIRPDGFIVTNDHVVGNAQDIQVTLSDGKKVQGELWGRDPQSDLAIVRIRQNNLPYAQLGDSDEIAVGDPVIAVGNALGLGTTVTTGIVSARERTVRGERGVALERAIQTDAAINRGNSGGALALLNGDVVGINTAIFSTGQDGGNIGIGFAIPSNTVRKIASELISNRQVQRPDPAWMGIWYQALTSDLAAYYEQQFNITYQTPVDGIVIQRVEPGSPAQQAGLKDYDNILTIDGIQVDSIETFADAIRARKPGDTVSLEVWRPAPGARGEKITVEVKLSGVPQALMQPEAEVEPPRRGRGFPF